MSYELITLIILFALFVWTSWDLKIVTLNTERRCVDFYKALEHFDDDDRTETLFDRRTK